MLVSRDFFQTLYCLKGVVDFLCDELCIEIGEVEAFRQGRRGSSWRFSIF